MFEELSIGEPAVRSKKEYLQALKDLHPKHFPIIENSLGRMLPDEFVILDLEGRTLNYERSGEIGRLLEKEENEFPCDRKILKEKLSLYIEDENGGHDIEYYLLADGTVVEYYSDHSSFQFSTTSVYIPDYIRMSTYT